MVLRLYFGGKNQKMSHPEVYLYNVGGQGSYSGVRGSVNLDGKNYLFFKKNKQTNLWMKISISFIRNVGKKP